MKGKDKFSEHEFNISFMIEVLRNDNMFYLYNMEIYEFLNFWRMQQKVLYADLHHVFFYMVS